jgi:hypothetical protein
MEEAPSRYGEWLYIVYRINSMPTEQVISATSPYGLVGVLIALYRKKLMLRNVTQASDLGGFCGQIYFD